MTQPGVGAVEWFEPGERARAERVLDLLRALGLRRLRTGVTAADWGRPDGRGWYAWLLPRLAADLELLPCLRAEPGAGLEELADELLARHGDLFDALELPGDAGDLAAAAERVRAAGKLVVVGVEPADADAVGLGHADVVGVRAFPAFHGGAWRGWDAELEPLRAAGHELWIVETGFSTWHDDEVGQLAAFLEALDAPVARLYWHAAQDARSEGRHADPRRGRLGLTRADGRPKLLARTLAGDGVPLRRRLVALRSPGGPARRSVTLVTGGAGFVGTNVADRLLREGGRVRVLDSLARPGVETNLLWLEAQHGSRLEIELGDVRDGVAVERAVRGVDAVLHFAAQVAVTTSLDDPVDDFRTNVEGTVGLLEALRGRPERPPVLFTSTNKVYGALPDVELERIEDRWLPVEQRYRDHGVSEERPLDFCTPYGCSKGAADQYVLDYAKSFGFPAVVFRMSCIYGPHQHGTEDQGWVAHFLIRALQGESISIYGDGAQVRDVLHVDDLVEAMLGTVAQAEALAGRAFNVGGGPDNTLSLLELLDLIADLHGSRPAVRHDDERPGDQRYYVSDTRRLQHAIGWRPRIGAAEGVEALYRRLAGARVHALAAEA